MASSAGHRSTDVISFGSKVLKSATTEEMQLCAECATVAASCRCIKCECFMCFACFEEVHKVSKYMRKHQYEPLAATDLSKGCTEHLNRQIEYFCIDDEKAICAHCVVMGSHKNHTVCSLEERKQQLLEAIAPLSSKANDALARLRKTMVMIDTLISTSQSHEDAVVADLQKHFDKLCFIFKSRKEKLELEFRDACADKRLALNEIRSDISLRKKCLEEALASLSQLKVSCFTENSRLLETLQGMITHDYTVPSSFLSNIQLDLNSTTLIDDIMLHGKVIVNGDEVAPSETITVNRLDSGNCPSTSAGIALRKNQVVTHSQVVGDCQPKLHSIADMPQSPPCLRRMTDIPSSIMCSQPVASYWEVQNNDVDSISVRSLGASIAHHSGSVPSPVPVKMENSSPSQLKIFPLSSSAVDPLQRSNSDQELPHDLPSSNFLNLINETDAASSSPFGPFRQTDSNCNRPSQSPVAQDVSLLSWKQGLDSLSYVKSSEAAYQSSVFSVFSNRMEPVVISHIHHPGFFWVHFTKDLEQLARLSQSIQDYCNGSHPATDNLQKRFDVGHMVLAKFRDETWYRAQIIAKHNSETDKTVEVLFIDYGNTDSVAIDKVQAIRPFFLKVPQLVSSCCLADIVPSSGSDTWSREAVESFARMASNLPMMMKVVKQDSTLKVRMSWPLGNGIRDDQMLYVNDALVFLEHATYISPDCKLPNVDKKVVSKYIHPVVPQKDAVVPVIITSVKSPQEFFVQICEKDSTYFVDMMKDVQITCTTDLHNVLGLFLPCIGNSCLANFGDDHQPHWCRAEVIKLLSKGHVWVRNVDFGGEKEVSVFQLKKLIDKFQVIPAQATACCLADVEPVPGRPWDTAASQLLANLGANSLFMSIKEISSGPLLHVYMSTDASFPSENLVNFMLISKNLAVSSRTSAKPSSELPENCANSPSKLTSEKLTCSSLRLRSLTSPTKEQRASVANLPKVIVSHFVSPKEFYIQVAAPKNLQCLENLMQDLNVQYENSTSNADAEWKCSDVCIARFSRDQRWYRAKITAITGDQVKVLCGDYGYSDVICAGDLRPVEPRFMSIAWFSTRCHLFNVKPPVGANKWPESTCKMLKKMICQKMCHISIKGPAVSNSLPADIMLTETVKGSALMPDREIYVSITDWLFDQQMAGPVNCQKSSPDLVSKVDDSDVDARSSESAEDSDDSVANPVELSTNHGLQQNTYCRSTADFPMPEVPNVNSFNLAVTFVDQDCCIYGQEKKADLQLLSNLMQRVHSCYRYTMPESTSTVWTLGQPVAAQFLDDNRFYRAKIVGFCDDGIEVQYVDYGNKEVLRKERLRILNESFLMVPVQCFVCRLFNIRSAYSSGRWPEATIDAVDELVNNKLCRITIRETDAKGSKLLVDLKLPTGQDLGSLLCEKGLAIRGSDITAEKSSSGSSSSPPAICNGNVWSQLPVRSKRLLPERTVASPYARMSLPALGNLLHVIVTEIDHPNALYIQHIPVKSPDDVLQQINLDLSQLLQLSSVYSSDAILYQPLMENELVPGTPCVARYSVDDCWYRAEIICTSQVRGHTEVGVRFVDYGSSDFVSVNRLRAIPVEHMTLPAQCRKCRLYGVEVLSDDESYLAIMIEKLTKLFADCVVVAAVKCVLPDGDILVDLFDRDLYLKIGSMCPFLYQCLIDDGLLDFTNGKSRDIVQTESSEEEEGSFSLHLESATE